MTDAGETDRRAWQATGPVCGTAYDGRFWESHPCIKDRDHADFHTDWWGRTWDQVERTTS